MNLGILASSSQDVSWRLRAPALSGSVYVSVVCSRWVSRDFGDYLGAHGLGYILPRLDGNVMAAVDGITDKINPGAPLDVDSTVWTPKNWRGILILQDR